MTENDTLIAQDLAVLWHPCTQMKDHEGLPLIPIRSGRGVWLEDFAGRRYLDAISSWWVNLFGHANPDINAAIKQQVDTLEHVLLAGFTHEPIIRLSSRLVKLAPPGLSRCFYTDNGSAAVEVALKMSYHYWRNCGAPRKTKFITLTNSYHGETLGALAVGDVSLYKETYAPLLMQVITVASPDCYHREAGSTWREHSIAQFAAMRSALEQHAADVCAVIVEPLVQCAGGMRMYDPVYLQLLRKACDEFNVHLIVDEIATGFGRTGTLFASEQAGITPDLLCLGKGLTGGYLPMAVVMSTDKIYQAFYADYATLRAFLHSHSYTGNPLACAAANASLDLFATHHTLQNNQHLSQCMHDAIIDISDHPHVAEIRQHGMILAIEMVKDKTTREPYPWQERRGLRAYQSALAQEVLLRPLGNVIYFMPPYVISTEEIQLMANAAKQAIHTATREE
jgi:adenosylmethionine-8-amino-7-oxononanoate aminotransferase